MENSVEEGKTIAITSYILIVGVLIAMSMNSENKNSFASFHIRQALGISLTFISLGLIISNHPKIFQIFQIRLTFTEGEGGVSARANVQRKESEGHCHNPYTLNPTT